MSRAATAPRAASTAGSAPKPLIGSGYFQATELPLASLAFVLPFIVIYELGTKYFAYDPQYHTEQRIVAFSLLAKFFSWCGASGRYLPALAVVFCLLGSHVARRDSWQLDVRYLFGMLIESVLLAIPLIGVGVLAARYIPLAAFHTPPTTMLILSIGAGIYEELIFRLLLITVLSFVLIDWLKMSKTSGAVVIILSSSILFALYHYLGAERFEMQTFVFRTLAGCYFATIFLYRGFGISAGSHAAYDTIVVLMHSVV